MTKWDSDALSAPHSQREIGMIEDGEKGNPVSGEAWPDASVGQEFPACETSDLISRETALLPCPFCGGQSWLNDYEAKHGGMTASSRCPQCKSCGCTLGYFPTAYRATDAWNRRAIPSAQPTAEVERLRRNNSKLHDTIDKCLTEGAALLERAEKAEAALAAMTENAKAMAVSLEWMLSETDTNRGDEPMPDHGGRTWNEINSYWIAHEDAASEALAAHNKLMEGK